MTAYQNQRSDCLGSWPHQGFLHVAAHAEEEVWLELVHGGELINRFCRLLQALKGSSEHFFLRLQAS